MYVICMYVNFWQKAISRQISTIGTYHERLNVCLCNAYDAPHPLIMWSRPDLDLNYI